MLFCEKWKKITGEEVRRDNLSDGGPHEANFLKLDCSKIKKTFGWRPTWDVETAMEKIIEWAASYFSGEDVVRCTERQIEEFVKLVNIN